mmetsp:Transcript_40907/g.47029  ORF Transcript_40907/g.47029 Transcript_40907/m.47029 type:complete len:201 (-) Transcript_40907:238-840(-)
MKLSPQLEPKIFCCLEPMATFCGIPLKYPLGIFWISSIVGELYLLWLWISYLFVNFDKTPVEALTLSVVMFIVVTNINVYGYKSLVFKHPKESRIYFRLQTVLFYVLNFLFFWIMFLEISMLGMFGKSELFGGSSVWLVLATMAGTDVTWVIVLWVAYSYAYHLNQEISDEDYYYQKLNEQDIEKNTQGTSGRNAGTIAL